MGDSSRVTFGLNAKPGLQVGQKGRKYGLVKPAASSVFGMAVLEEESTAEVLRRDAAAKHTNREVQQMHASALEEDPTAFDYDGVYDAMQTQRSEQSNAAKARDNKPRYIGSIIEAAKQRTVENDRVFERKLLKEQKVDAELYTDKEKFVTGAYRAKLAERAAHDVELRKEAAIEAKEDVTKRRDLADFHRNLLFGNPGTRAVPKPPAEPTPEPAAADEPRAESAVEAPQQAAAAQEQAASSDARSLADGGEAAAHPSVASFRAGPHDAVAAAARPREGAPKRALAAPVEAQDEETAAQAARLKLARRNDEGAVVSARDRYLQRKAAAGRDQ
ncbi:coiled-coil domain-containing protein 55-domain containing protein [Pavlovales sp. CCMP2436]|nr:coiled-coil domain-containing protein 55-domain containing protein [Pavlovales sp. CCMP2436]